MGEQIREVISDLHEKRQQGRGRTSAGDMLELRRHSGERSGEYPHQFSGGMKQRVVIAIAPGLQPLSSSSPTSPQPALGRDDSGAGARAHASSDGALNTSIILITHDLGVEAKCATRSPSCTAGRSWNTARCGRLSEPGAPVHAGPFFDSLPDLDTEVPLNRAAISPAWCRTPRSFRRAALFENRCRPCDRALQNRMSEVQNAQRTHTVLCCRNVGGRKQ